MYLDPTLSAYGKEYNDAVARGDHAGAATAHAKAEAYRKANNTSYQGSVDGSTYTGPATKNSYESVSEDMERRTRKTSDASEASGGQSNTTMPSSNLQELKAAPDDFNMGKTSTGLVYVFGNVLDTLTAWGNGVFGFAFKYATPIITIFTITAMSKVFSYRKR